MCEIIDAFVAPCLDTDPSEMAHFAILNVHPATGGMPVADDRERNNQAAGETEPARFRTTVTLTEQELNSLDELRVHFRTATKRSLDRSEIIREAINHYYQDILAR